MGYIFKGRADRIVEVWVTEEEVKEDCSFEFGKIAGYWKKFRKTNLTDKGWIQFWIYCTLKWH